MKPSRTDAPTDLSRAFRSAVTLQVIQEHVGGTISGDPASIISGVNGLEAAQPGDLTFADGPKHAALVRQSRAAACLVPGTFPDVDQGPALLRVPNPRFAFVRAIELLQPQTPTRRGIHREAVVASDAELGEDVTIGECAVVRSRARIGRGTVIESGVHIGEGVSVGEECFIGPNVVIMYGCHIGHRVRIHGGTVIGADGFGYVWTAGGHVKIPQLGNVVVEDNVELGANVCVDRATFGSTIVKRGTKVDNLVQIAHNDVIGEHVVMAGQVGLAGSVRVGDRAVLGGQVGVADHVTIGPDTRVGGKAAVIGDLAGGQTYWGFPARPMARAKRELAALARLPEILKQLPRAPRKRRAAKR